MASSCGFFSCWECHLWRVRRNALLDPKSHAADLAHGSLVHVFMTYIVGLKFSRDIIPNTPSRAGYGTKRAKKQLGALVSVSHFGSHACRLNQVSEHLGVFTVNRATSVQHLARERPCHTTLSQPRFSDVISSTKQSWEKGLL